MSPDRGGDPATTPFASLPMYDWPQVSRAWDALWRGARALLAEAGIAAAPELRRSSDHTAAWRAPDLLLGQTCGWPFISRLADAVVPFARFDFDIGVARAGDYRSVFVMRRADAPAGEVAPAEFGEAIARGALRLAVNGFDSQSGWRALSECVSRNVALAKDRVVTTGSHVASIRAVAGRQADFAAIDAVSWRLAQDHEPAAAALAVVAHSGDTPGLPLISAPAFARHAPILREALSAALAALPVAMRGSLHLRGVAAAEAGDYRVLLNPPFGRLALA
jgi:ABC-type phosphate/phosphonate transport system substrate-binding protein